MMTIIMQKITFVLASLTMCSQQMMHLNGRLREWTSHLTGFSPILKQKSLSTKIYGSPQGTCCKLKCCRNFEIVAANFQLL